MDCRVLKCLSNFNGRCLNEFSVAINRYGKCDYMFPVKATKKKSTQINKRRNKSMSKRNDVKLTEMLNEKGFTLAAKYDPTVKYACPNDKAPSRYWVARAMGKMIRLYQNIFTLPYTQAERTRYVKYCKVLLASAFDDCLDYERAFEDFRIQELIDRYPVAK